MRNQIKNKNSLPASKAGFIEIIVIVIVALLLMKYFEVTISEAINWFKSFFGSILK